MPLKTWFNPKNFWVVALFLFARMMAILPLSWVQWIGARLGNLMYWLAPKRRQIAKVNISICFPQLTSKAQEALVKQHFESAGMGYCEAAMGWWASSSKIKPLYRIQGLDIVKNALELGRGVILISGHMVTLDLSARFFADNLPFCGLYRPHENPLFNDFMTSGRERVFSQVIPHDNLRAAIRALKSGQVVGYVADQDHGEKHSVFAPFFGIPAATLAATSKLAQLSGALCVIGCCHRTPKGYNLEIAELKDYPSEDVLADATQVNRFLEKNIRQVPEQYLWMHRRFKTRPSGYPPLYPDKIRKPDKIRPQRYKKLIAGARVIEGTPGGIKVMLSSAGSYLKFFHDKGWHRRFSFSSYAMLFARNTRKLKALGIPTVRVRRIYQLPESKSQMVVYEGLEGKTIEQLLLEGKFDSALQKKVVTFIARLHERGVYFRSLHFGNILLCSNGQIGLIDVADMRFKSRSLAIEYRVRNFRHFFSYLQRCKEALKQVFNEEQKTEFLDLYLDEIQAPKAIQQKFKAVIQ